jgi:SPP1 family phage portal protein
MDGEGYNWDRLPLIAFKYNNKEIPLIRAVKSLHDALNQVLSDFQNNMEEDPRTTILVLKNYDGTNIPEFRQNLATYGVIKVTTVDGVQGGVETLNVEVNAANYQAILMQLKRAIVENGRGFDAKEERMDGDPNQMNIESMYTDIDLDVNAMETEFQAGFEELKWFIDQYLIHQGNPDYSEENVNFVFNRDIFINEDAKIQNCAKSVGIISNKTIVARHPWVTNLEHELKQIEEDKQAELDEMDATLKLQNKNNPQPSKGGGDE